MTLKNAKAYIKGGSKFPNINGVVYFKQLKEGVMITANIKGLPKSENECKR